MADIFIPTLHTFAMKNPFTGSCGMFRFRIKPNVEMATPKEVDFEKSSITAVRISRVEEVCFPRFTVPWACFGTCRP